MVLYRRLNHRSTRRVLQISVLTLWGAGAVGVVLSDSRLATVLSLLVTGLLALGAVKLALVALVSSDRSADVSTKALVTSQEGLETAQTEVEAVHSHIHHAREQTDSLRSELKRLSRLIQPSIALVELKEQELMALREQLFDQESDSDYQGVSDHMELNSENDSRSQRDTT